MHQIENIFNARREWSVCLDETGGGGAGGELWDPHIRERGGDCSGKGKGRMGPLVVCVLLSEPEGGRELGQMSSSAAGAVPPIQEPSSAGDEAGDGVHYVIDLGNEVENQGAGGSERKKCSSQRSRHSVLKAAILTSSCAGYNTLVKGLDLPLLVFWRC